MIAVWKLYFCTRVTSSRGLWNGFRTCMCGCVCLTMLTFRRLATPATYIDWSWLILVRMIIGCAHTCHMTLSYVWPLTSIYQSTRNLAGTYFTCGTHIKIPFSQLFGEKWGMRLWVMKWTFKSYIKDTFFSESERKWNIHQHMVKDIGINEWRLLDK